jgi:cell wall-associated NlpC family hydrolase
MPKFSLCDDGIAWFQSKGKWKSRGYSPAPGTLIFFDWNGDGTSDHVGIVEKTEGSTVYTVEGNSSDAVNQSKRKWKSRGYSPAPGTLIFFDWNGDGTSDHVGIVEKTEGSTVYTVEGNSSDAVNQRSYDINNGTIMGYGIL